MFSGQSSPFTLGERIALVGDLQRTSALEFWRERNDPERARIVAAISALRPAAVVVLGDLVFAGASAAAWRELDRLTQPWRDAKLAVYAVPGNHEYWLTGRGITYFYERFAHQPRAPRCFVLRRGPLAMVMLDSNDRWLSRSDWTRQQQHYEATLDGLDRDPEVRGVLVLTHHPPFTNSTLTGDEAHVVRAFVPALVRAKKGLGMITGHVHSYERFERQGRLFVVSGGGGGPRARVSLGARRRHTDDLYDGGALRPFHFLSLALDTSGITVDVVGLDKGASATRVIDSFTRAFEAP